MVPNNDQETGATEALRSWSPLEKEATRRQSTEIKIYGLLAIMVLRRLVPRDCWLVVVLAQNERYYGRLDA
jgi:hypothetical protein